MQLRHLRRGGHTRAIRRKCVISAEIGEHPADKKCQFGGSSRASRPPFRRIKCSFATFAVHANEAALLILFVFFVELLPLFGEILFGGDDVLRAAAKQLHIASRDFIKHRLHEIDHISSLQGSRQTMPDPR